MSFRIVARAITKEASQVLLPKIHRHRSFLQSLPPRLPSISVSLLRTTLSSFIAAFPKSRLEALHLRAFPQWKCVRRATTSSATFNRRGDCGCPTSARRPAPKHHLRTSPESFHDGFHSADLLPLLLYFMLPLHANMGLLQWIFFRRTPPLLPISPTVLPHLPNTTSGLYDL